MKKLLLLVFIAIFALLLKISINPGLTGFLIWQSEFNEGSHNQTFYNSSFIQLVSNQSSGTYISKVFDAGKNSSWSNISWVQELLYQQELQSNQNENILLMHMNENSGTIIDYSGQGNNGTVISATYGEDGKFNSALSFNGINDYVEVSDDNSLDITGNITLEAWIYPKSLITGNFYGIVGKRSDTTTNYELDLNGQKVRFYFYASGWNVLQTNTNVINTNQWQHIAATYDSINNPKIYVNGIEKTCIWTYGGIAPLTINSVSILMGHNGGLANSDKYLNGSVDEVAIWNRTLSSDEILNIYKRGILKLNLSAKSCNRQECEDEFTDISDVPPQNLELYGRYFQYKVDFATENILYSPQLYNVTIDYNLINLQPSLILNSPENNTITTNNHIILDASAYDPDLDNLTIWLYGDDILLNTLYNQTNSNITYDWTSLSNGLHNWTAIVNDGTENSSSEYRYFTKRTQEQPQATPVSNIDDSGGGLIIKKDKIENKQNEKEIPKPSEKEIKTKPSEIIDTLTPVEEQKSENPIEALMNAIQNFFSPTMEATRSADASDLSPNITKATEDILNSIFKNIINSLLFFNPLANIIFHSSLQ